jgi:hypothetical protein
MLTDAKLSPYNFKQRHSSEVNLKTPKSLVREQIPKSKCMFQSKPADDLTGITITFQKSPELNNTARSRRVSPRSGELYHCSPPNVLDTGNFNRPDKERGANVLDEIVMNSQGNMNMISYAEGQTNGNKKQWTVSMMGKENSMTPKNSSRGSPLRLVRNFGGRSALKNKIKKMRSPKMSPSTMMGGQVQVILH